MYKIICFITLIFVLIFITSCIATKELATDIPTDIVISYAEIESETESSTKATEVLYETNDKHEEDLLKQIYSKDKSYANADVKSFPSDYDGDGKEEIFYVFIKPKLLDNGEIGSYFMDIWFGGDIGVKQIEEAELFFAPNDETYGKFNIKDKTYFRYELAWATGSTTIIINVYNNEYINFFNAGGPINFSDNNEFTLIYKDYDAKGEIEQIIKLVPHGKAITFMQMKTAFTNMEQ